MQSCVVVLAAVAAVRGATTSEIDQRLRQLDGGTLDQRVEAARWLGLNGDEQTRSALARALLTVPGDAAHRRLIRTIELARNRLRDPPSPEMAERALERLGSGDTRERVSALTELALRERRDAVPRVASLLDDPDVVVREEALGVLEYLGDRTQRNRVLRLLDDPEGAVRLRALEYLVALGEPQLWPRLVELTADPNPWIARPCLERLVTDPGAPAAASALVARVLGPGDAQVRARYLDGLRAFRAAGVWSAEYVAALEPLWDAGDERVRLATATLLADDRPQQARRTLLRLLESEDPRVREGAATELSAGTGAALGLGEIELLLDDPQPQVRRAALQLAAALPQRRGRDLVIRVLDRPDEEDEVRALALSLFPELGRSGDVPLVLRWARGDASPLVRTNAILAVARLEQRLGTSEAHDWYRDRLADPGVDPQARQTIVRALQVVGDPSFLPQLAEELRTCPPEAESYAGALSLTISVLLGRSLHGPDFAMGDVR